MQTPPPIGWAILGCGRVADKRIAPAIRASGAATLAAVCSRSLDKARDFAARHEATHAYGDVDAFLNDASVEIVYIATPNSCHLSDALRCFAAGKHVMVDKPMALSVRDSQAIIDAARASGCRLGIMHQQRFHPANRQAVEMVHNGVLGKLLMVRAQVGMWYPPTDNWRLTPDVAGGGVTMDLGPHALDILCEIGGPIREVAAIMRNLAHAYPVEDFCCARLEFANGAIGLCDMAYCYHDYGGRLEIFGDQGSLAIRGSLQQAATYQSWLRIGDRCEPPVDASYPGCFADGIRDFTEAVQTGRPAAITPADGVRVLSIIEAMHESARLARPVAVS